ncbi:VCBS repeat-containing protein [Streptomyces sp. TX20-6-3]|uniref:FG-GAP repeat domain-containing protein n=1 Tax=Streptomyces sp. TX20-6-3 TaxID=3028705 RepID=UPI0029B971A4|nr:VCBS repeat-containing protein [Streptomyces sp. TX20-6-3]MDX2562631.1 VCBS repeat-containing protein [Streptomyces sp. TX20-6-3]
MQLRTTGTRLATAVTVVLAVTALGAGTLATAPAAFAATPAAVAAPADQADTALPVYPEGTDLAGVGASGFLTYSFTEDGRRKLLWTPYDGGARTALDPEEGGGWTMGPGDVVVFGDDNWSSEMRSITLRDMATPSAPGVDIDLGALNGNYVAALSPTSVLAQLTNAVGQAELHVVTKDGTTTTTRKISGLPAGATDYFGSKAHDGSVLVGYETGPEGARTGGRALVDLAAGTVTKTYASPESGYGFGGLNFSASHVTWFGYEAGTGDYITSVDRTTGTEKKTVLGPHTAEWFHTLAGDWLVHGNPTTPVRAVSLTTGETRELLDSGTAASTAADGTAIVRGERAADGKGLFRIEIAEDGTPKVTKVADDAPLVDLEIQQVHVPDTVNLDRTGGKVTLGWTLSHREAYVDVRLTHMVTEQVYVTRVYAPAEGNLFSFTWDAVLDGADAPNGSYAVEAEAMLLDGTGDPVQQGWQLNVVRTINPHDYTNNGSTDVLARDAAGALWRDDLRDRPVDGKVVTAGRTRIGTGWGAYKQIEAVGDLAGNEVGDLVALDGAGVLWHYLGKRDGTFETRVKIGTGWGAYNKLTGGSDLDGDGRSDLLATDTTGVLWFYKGTGDAAKPFATRARVGGGWGSYNHLTAVGNIAGTGAGDLVARDASGVLWLYQGNGSGNFAARVQIGGGWGSFSQLVGAGDVDSDGRPDLIAYGTGGTYVYRSTGSATAPFSRVTTDLYAGEGTKFNHVA